MKLLTHLRQAAPAVCLIGLAACLVLVILLLTTAAGTRQPRRFDTGEHVITRTNTAPMLDDATVLGTITLQHGAWVELHVDYREDVLVENLTDQEQSGYAYTHGYYLKIADVMAAPCNTLCGPPLAAYDDVPYQFDNYDGVHVDYQPGDDHIGVPMHFADFYAPLVVFLPAGVHEIRAGTYGFMQSWNGQQPQPYQGHSPYRCLDANSTLRVYGSVRP